MGVESTGPGERQGPGGHEVARLSRLARLGLTGDELAELEAQLKDIIEAVGKLSQADISQVDPTTQVGGLSNAMRDDVVVPGLSAEQALANAPTTEAGLLRVPAIQ
ncbi:MAG: Asp-tRNA(Asn)/Glu-tRNA(Gln) amidotransferase subunit GatC [Candidatus Dormibacteraeota bacterium]|nr:Asp-tRNA(Asn)/Glu-tRNA(Gln) amidotransferase subunit GatC [Candidatus Dormibacteraeota bacterium]